MKLKFTLHRPQQEQADLVVTADATATVGAIAEKLARHDPSLVAGQQGDLTLAVTPPATGTGTLRSARTIFANLDPKALIADAPIRPGTQTKASE